MSATVLPFPQRKHDLPRPSLALTDANVIAVRRVEVLQFIAGEEFPEGDTKAEAQALLRHYELHRQRHAPAVALRLASEEVPAR